MLLALVLRGPTRAGSDPGTGAQGAQARGDAPECDGGGRGSDPDATQTAPAMELPAGARQSGGGGTRAAGAGRTAGLRDGVPLHEAPRTRQAPAAAATRAGAGIRPA